MTDREFGPNITRLSVGDGVTSFGDVNGNDFRDVVEGSDGLLARAGSGFIEVDIAPGVYYTPTGAPTWTKGATRFNVSRAAVFIPTATAPAAQSDALVMHVAAGTDDIDWIGGTILAPAAVQAQARAERTALRFDCNRARVHDIAVRCDYSPVPLASLNLECFFGVGFGPAHQRTPDIADAAGVNNCELVAAVFHGEDSAVATALDGRGGLFRCRKTAHFVAQRCIVGSPWHPSNAAAKIVYQNGAGFIMEDCYASDIDVKFGPDDFSDCFGRDVVCEPHFNFTFPFVEGGHALYKFYAHTSRFKNVGFDLRNGLFARVLSSTMLGQIMCPTHSKPAIWVRPGTHTAVGVDVTASNFVAGTAIRIQDGDGGDVTLTAVAGSPAANQFQVGASASASIDNFKAALQLKWQAGSIRAFARKKSLAAGAYRALVTAFGRAGKAPTALTVTITAGGTNVSIANNVSRPHRGSDVDIGGTIHWASDESGPYNHPAVRVDKAYGRVGIDVRVDHVREFDPAWNTATKLDNAPIVITDVTFLCGTAQARPFVSSDYDESGVFQDVITEFTAGREPHLYSLRRTEGRVFRAMLDGNKGFANFAGLWTSDGTVDGTMVEEGHNYINGSVTAST